MTVETGVAAVVEAVEEVEEERYDYYGYEQSGLGAHLFSRYSRACAQELGVLTAAVGHVFQALDDGLNWWKVL